MSTSNRFKMDSGSLALARVRNDGWRAKPRAGFEALRF
jgi:hypothetical protein